MRRVLTLALIALTIMVANAQVSPDSVSSTYRKGVFHTHITRHVNAGIEQTNQMLDSLISQFQINPEMLYDWALEGTGQQHDGTEKDDVILILRSTTYNPKAHRSVMIFDVDVPAFKRIKDITIESIITSEKPNHDIRHINVDMYTSLVLKHAHGILTAKQIAPGQCILKMDVDIKFGWFFNLFITQKKYKALAEFRLVKFINNLKYCASHPTTFIGVKTGGPRKK